MKKKKIFSIVLLVSIMVGMIGIGSIAEETDFEERENIIVQWGNYLSAQFYNNADSSESTEDSEIKQTIMFYKLQGYESSQAQDLAVQYVKQSNAIYQKALEEGYNVTEEEVAAYVEWLKDMYHNDPELNESSKKQMETMICSFDNEDDYWEYLRGVYRKSLASQNYIEDLQKDFFSSNPKASYEEWENYFKDWKNKLIAKN